MVTPGAVKGKRQGRHHQVASGILPDSEGGFQPPAGVLTFSAELTGGEQPAGLAEGSRWSFRAEGKRPPEMRVGWSSTPQGCQELKYWCRRGPQTSVVSPNCAYISEPKRQRTAALQDADARSQAPENAERLGVRLSSAAFESLPEITAILRHHTS